MAKLVAPNPGPAHVLPPDGRICLGRRPGMLPDTLDEFFFPVHGLALLKLALPRRDARASDLAARMHDVAMQHSTGTLPHSRHQDARAVLDLAQGSFRFDLSRRAHVMSGRWERNQSHLRARSVATEPSRSSCFAASVRPLWCNFTPHLDRQLLADSSTSIP